MPDHQPPIQRLHGDPPSPFEELYGYSRIVEAGGWVTVGGTTAIHPEGYVVGETPYDQSVEIFRKLVHEVDRVGLVVADTVHVRMYVTDISRANEVLRAFGETFGATAPAATMVEVTALIDPRLLVEIELSAYRR